MNESPGTVSKPPEKTPLAAWVLAASLVVVLVLAGWFALRLQQVQHSLATSEGRLSSLSAEKDRLQGDNELFNKQIQAFNGQIQELEKEKERLEGSLKQEREKLAGELTSQKDLEAELRRTLESKDVKISQLEGRLKVTVANRILFESGSAELLPEGSKVLDQFARVVLAAGKQNVRVEGHTDNVAIGPKLLPMFPTNWELSTARATRAVRHLLEHGKLPAERLTAAGFADMRPVAPNDTESNRARNRRVEIILTPVGGDSPTSSKTVETAPSREE